MSRFIYLVVLKCTGRTCNAHLVIGGDVVASSRYVYIFLQIIVLCQYVCSLILYLLVYFVFCIYMKITPKVFVCFVCLVAGFFFNLAGDGEGGGGYFMEAFYFATILGQLWNHFGSIL